MSVYVEESPKYADNFFFIPTEEGTAISMWSSGPCEVLAVRKAKAVPSSSIVLRPSGVEAATSRSAF